MGDKKSLAVGKLLLEKCREKADGSVTPMQLIKLAYIAHGFMLGAYGRPLLTESVEAWQYGPVIPSLYHALKKYRDKPVDVVEGAPPFFEMDPEEVKVIEFVAKNYSKYDAITLSSATHREGSPWSVSWDGYTRGAPISDDVIEAFYKRIVTEGKHVAL